MIKEGEQTKRKSYRSVVWISVPVTKDDLSFLTTITDLQIYQKTPIRVLHRRTLETRKKFIHKMSYTWVNPNLIILDLETQAGTYIKEFVHGDLGRTRPNLCSLLIDKFPDKKDSLQTDILQLDVMEIHMVWPPK